MNDTSKANNALLTMSIIQVLLTYGPKAIIAISESMKRSEVTHADIENLFIDKKPEDFF